MMYTPAQEAASERLRALLATALLFVVCMGAWLGWDMWREHERTLDQTRRLAMQKSQFVSSAFGDTFLATDYVLRDVLWHAQNGDAASRVAPAGRYGDAGSLEAMEALLRAKRASIPALTDIVVFDGNCIFQALAVGRFHGRHSTQAFCKDLRVGSGEHLHIQYLPVERSASRRPVITLARTRGDAEGHLLGGVLAVLDLGNAQQWLSGFKVDGQDSLALMDTEGRLLAPVPEDAAMTGQHLNPTPGQPALDQLVGTASFIGDSPVDGRTRVYGISRLEQFPIIALVGMDQASVLRSWLHRSWLFALGYAGLLGLVLMLLRSQFVMTRQRGELQKLAATDALTGIANRRHLLATGRREFARSRRSGSPLAVLLLDLDRFKSINDRWGHGTGDRVIQGMARTLELLARRQDIAGRLGGEEFALILPDTDAPGAVVIAERLRAAVQGDAHVHADTGDTVHYTVSAGISVIHPQDAGFEAILQRADRALYRAKERGRNRVEIEPARD